MTAGIPLFIAEPTGTCRLVLRRFRHGPGSGHYHDASAVIDENAPVSAPRGGRVITGDRVSHGEPGWPERCPCGEAFTDADEWQVNELDWYEGAGHRFAFGVGSWGGPPGAMIRADWRDDEGRPPGWLVFLPNGRTWCTNERATAEGSRLGPYWDVTGEPPLITVSPSIDDRGSQPWHGWIRDGELVQA